MGAPLDDHQRDAQGHLNRSFVMRWLTQVIFHVKSLFLKRRLDEQLSEEIRTHVEMATEANLAAGMKPEEARYAALREFGNVAGVQERAREGRGGLWLEQGWQDFNYAIRALGKTPGFTAMAVLTLALGISATTAMFSVIYGVLLEPYPYAKPGEIWSPRVVDPKTNRGPGMRLSDYQDIARLPGVGSAMATAVSNVTLSGGTNPEIVTAPQLTGTAFEFLGVPPVLGRGLTPADIQANGEPEPVTVLSFRLWHRLFNGDPGVLGRTITINDQPHTIVGVMPPRFGWFTNDGLWRPMPATNPQQGVIPILRLKPGVESGVVAEQLLALMKEKAQQEPKRFPADGFVAQLVNYLDMTVASGVMRTSLHVLFGAVGFLLLIACTNVANLQLARGAGRSREMAVRLALGAGRGRLVRQLLTESVVLALAGGALGVLFSIGLVRLIVLLMPDFYVPNEARVTLNGWVLLFSVGISVLAGVVSGLMPGLQSTKPNLTDALKDGGHAGGTGSQQGNRTRSALVVAQVALSVTLLVGACLAIRNFAELMRADRGIQIERMIFLRVPLAAKRYTTVEQRNAFARDLQARLQTLPGVTSVAIGSPPGLETRSGVTIPGQPKPAESLFVNYLGTNYLSTLGIRVVAGRDITEQEVATGARVALINETTAKLWVNGESPLDRIISVDSLVGGNPNNLPAAGATKDVRVVGIIADTRTRDDPRRPAPPVVLVPFTLVGSIQRIFMIRCAVEPSSLHNAIRVELRAVDKEQPLAQLTTFADMADQQFRQPRFNLALFSALALIALVMAAAGIYGVLSYAVAQRSREIGVRIALGADRGDVLRLIFGTGGRLLVIGLVIGLAASAALTRVVNSRLFDGPPLDLVALAVATLLLSTTAALACWLPARRAAKVDPMVALRAD